ncbi:MAG: hydantoinase/oxoprolinase family protein, partial [Chloroflexi bacterium]|nr:hydantoinase/oxoprolinase family protein [Chloroflexota bacterium]
MGGTFTDFVLLDEERGAVLVGKCLTTPADPGEGFLAGASRLLGASAVGYGDLAAIVHGTTLVANALIERRGAVTGLITSQGCRDILEVSREVRYDLYDLFIEFPQPLAPRSLRHEVAERALADGSTYVPLDLDGVRAAARQLVADGATSVAVVFLHSHRNPDPELAAGRLLAAELPELDVSLSCQVAPEIREYERTSTTLANAYVRPLVRRYLGHLEAELGELGYAGELYVMLSAGGVTTATIAADVPVHLVESGPAAGALAASFYGGLTGRPQLVSFDMGGTTAKICLINDGKPDGAH